MTEKTENVIPEEEINRRRRVAELAHEVGDLFTQAIVEIHDVINDASERLSESSSLVSFKDFLPMVMDHSPPGIREWIRTNLGREMYDGVFDQLEAFFKLKPSEIDTFWNEMMGLGVAHDGRRDKMVKLVDRLLSEAPRMEGASADDAGAVECQILLRNGYRAVGALAKTPEGLLKFGAVAREDPQAALQEGRQPRVMMTTHYFDYDDLEAIVIPQPMVEESKPKIFTGLG